MRPIKFVFLFGTDETLLALTQRYMIPVKVVFSLFLFNQMLAAFLRNDKNPGLATAIGYAVPFVLMVKAERLFYKLKSL